MKAKTKCLIGYDTYFIQVLTNTETNLCRTKRQDITYVRLLLLDDRSSCRRSCTKDWYSALHASTSFPLVQPFCKKPFQELVKQLERSNVIRTNHNCRTEAAHTLFYDSSRSNGRQNTVHNFFEKATGITAKLCPWVLATNFVQCSHHATAGEKVFFISRRKPRMILYNVLFPLFYKWQ